MYLQLYISFYALQHVCVGKPGGGIYGETDHILVWACKYKLTYVSATFNSVWLDQ